MFSIKDSAFNEAGYLFKYPDVAQAVANGDLKSGHEHFVRYGQAEGRTPPTIESKRSASDLMLFEHRAPSAQTAVDVFSGHWACDLSPILGVSDTGTAALFNNDKRPALMAESLGRGGSLQDMSILEIGPLEGAHSYALEKLGAKSIVAVESNREAWLKCLIVKELLKLERTSFLLGNIIEYLDDSKRFDAILCSGVLYHMNDPVELVKKMSVSSDRCFVWTQYYDHEVNPKGFIGQNRKLGNDSVVYWCHSYETIGNQFWGGIAPQSCWMTKNDIFQTFQYFGFNSIDVIDDDPRHPHGPAILFSASK